MEDWWKSPIWKSVDPHDPVLHVKSLAFRVKRSTNPEPVELISDFQLGSRVPIPEESKDLELCRTFLTDSEWADLPRLVEEIYNGDIPLIEASQSFLSPTLGQVLPSDSDPSSTEVHAEPVVNLDEDRRKIARAALKERFETDYLGAQEFMSHNFPEVLSFGEIHDMQINFIMAWANNRLNRKTSREQATAIGCVDGDVLVTARAGSGKTWVLVARAVFLVEHCGVLPSEVLLLAFNRKAADEIDSRLRDELGSKGNPSGADVEIPLAMTFHSLAYSLVHPKESLISDDEHGNRYEQSAVVQSVIDAKCLDPRFLSQVRKIMTSFFSDDWGHGNGPPIGASAQEGLAWLNQTQKCFNPEHSVRSFGEKLIANFLVRYQVKYWYELTHKWDDRQYRPDFTIDGLKDGLKSKVIVEYFGMTGRPDYDLKSDEKRAYWKREKQHLVEVYPDLIARGRKELEQYLIAELGKFCEIGKPLSDDEIWEAYKEDAISEFSKVVKDTINKCRQLDMSPEDLSNLVAQNLILPKEIADFGYLCVEIYREYLSSLKSRDCEDFGGLMSRASLGVEQGLSIFNRRGQRGDLSDLRFICVDEFQDFSAQFDRLMKAIKTSFPDSQLFCVGDDWQAINGFAGSDLKYFEYQRQSVRRQNHIVLGTNYRSQDSVVDFGNAIMKGFGPEARATRTGGDRVHYANLNDFAMTDEEALLAGYDLKLAAILRVVSQDLSCGGTVTLLGRVKRSFVSLEDKISQFLDEEQMSRVRCSTVHSYKGQEADCVVVLDASEDMYPHFHPHWIFDQIFGKTLENIRDDERRLLYVAATRARNRLTVLTAGPESQLLPSGRQDFSVAVQWDRDYPPTWTKSHQGQFVIVERGSASYDVKPELIESGFKWQDNRKHYSRTLTGIEPAELRSEAWSRHASGLTVVILDSGRSSRYRVEAGTWEQISF
jgi:DNA helicase-4